MDASLELLPLPAAHAQALRALADPDVEVAELAHVIEGDPALTTAMLRAANSASSAPVARIESAEVAVVRLGLWLTRRLLAGAVVSSTFQQIHEAGIDDAEMWRHVVATALLSQGVMWHAGRSSEAVAEAFTTGILHEVGRQSMATQDPERYARAAALIRSGDDARSAERSIFGFDHAAWGAEVSEAWQVADAITRAIGHHHEESADGLTQAVCTARRLAWSLGIGDGLVKPDQTTYPEQPADEEIVAELGGTEGLFEVIEWYRGALGSSPAAEAA